MTQLAGNATDPQLVNQADRRAKALELRKLGKSYRAIGAALGCDVAQAYRDVSASLAEIRTQCNETATELRDLELERLNRLEETLNDLLSSKLVEVARVDDESDRVPPPEAPQLIASLLRVAESRRKLLGLDAPTKALVQVHGKIEHVPDAELMPAVLAELEQTEAGREQILLAAARIRALPATTEGAKE